jgi:hypothetical protein
MTLERLGALFPIKHVHNPNVMLKAKVVKQFLEAHAADCVFCFIIKNGVTDTPHSNVSDCDVDMEDYRNVFRTSIVFSNGVCWKCGAAKTFGHIGTGYGNLCENEDLKEFIRPLAYIVLNSKELREQVFPSVQINPEHFLTHQLDYAAWLGLKAAGHTKWDHNLFEIVYAVAHLLKTGQLKRIASFEIPPGMTTVVGIYPSLTTF